MTVLNDQQNDEQSATQTAKDEASGVAGRAKEAAGGVAQTSTDQAKEVAGEVKRQARDLASEAKDRVNTQAGDQRQKAVGSLRSLGDELGQMAERSDSSGLGSELARQASTRAHDFAGLLESKEPGDLLDDVRSFARQRPGTFLLGALVAGIAVGRLTRGAVASHREDSDSTSNGSTTARPTTLSSSPGYDGDSFGSGTGAGYVAGSGTASDFGTSTAGEYGTGTVGDYSTSTASDDDLVSRGSGTGFADDSYSSTTYDSTTYDSTTYDPDRSGLDPLATNGVTAAGGSRPVGEFDVSDTDPLVDEPRRDLP